MKNLKKGKVFIVGAGPGDPELLTLKAARLLKEAQVCLYDKLVNPKILEMLEPHCLKNYVGKDFGEHIVPQEEINLLLEKFAREGKTVVRLKGGDPFVFGRGGEEALHLKKSGIDFEIIPGISSSIAAAAYAGIPITHRGVSVSFTVVTGHECAEKEGSQLDWKSLSCANTLVFMMGVRKRQFIASKLIEFGRSEIEPVAFVENGTTSKQKLIKTTLKELSVSPVLVESPAVMVVGPVVDLSNDLEWFQSGLLGSEPSFDAIN